MLRSACALEGITEELACSRTEVRIALIRNGGQPPHFLSREMYDHAVLSQLFSG